MGTVKGTLGRLAIAYLHDNSVRFEDSRWTERRVQFLKPDEHQSKILEESDIIYYDALPKLGAVATRK